MKINMIYNEDCLETMKKMPDNFIDLVITSPPYDDLRAYKGFSFDFCSTAKQLERGLKQGGIIVWIVNDKTVRGSESGRSFEQVLFFKKLGLNLHDTMIWDKGSCRFPETNRYYPCFEYMFVLSKGQPKTHHLIEDRPNKFANSKVARAHQIRTVTGEVIANSAFKIAPNRRIKPVGVRFNIWKIAVSASSGDKSALKHPASFPEQLVYDHIISWSNEGDLVYDPFMGSGTTGKMCLLSKRQYLGSEISKEYCEIAKLRGCVYK